MPSVSGLYVRSIVLSLISITVTILLSWRKRCKLTRSEQYKQTEQYSRAVCCHGWWSSISFLIVIGVSWLLWDIQRTHDLETEPIVDIKNKGSYKGGFCGYENRYNFYDNQSYTGDLISAPHMVYDDCYGKDYEFSVKCVNDENAESIKLLHCTLNWYQSYKSENYSLVKQEQAINPCIPKLKIMCVFICIQK